jgi:GNAT superfamily N-acetyltransferase
VPEARGRQIGERLLRTALKWCRERQIDAVILWPSKRSRTIYLRHGFAVPDDLFQLRGSKISRHRKDPTGTLAKS